MEPLQDQDAELMLRLNRGDQTAFEIIYRALAPELYGYARRNIQSAEDAQEIIQDIFESLWSRREELRIVSIRHYMFSMVRYKIIRYFRVKRVKQKYIDHYRLFEVAWESMPEEQRDSETIHTAIFGTLNVLPERCQETIRLRLLENLSTAEIAKRMNITKPTVRVYLAKAFNHLRTLNTELLRGEC